MQKSNPIRDEKNILFITSEFYMVVGLAIYIFEKFGKGITYIAILRLLCHYFTKTEGIFLQHISFFCNFAPCII